MKINIKFKTIKLIVLQMMNQSCQNERIYLCYETILCTESQECTLHCTHKNHFHCANELCDKTLCDKSSSYCVKHCTDTSHLHCPGKKCKETKEFCEKDINNVCWCHNLNPIHHVHCVQCARDTDICWDDGREPYCIYCCDVEPDGHETPYHCNVGGCGEVENICYECGRCPEHLYEECGEH